MRSKVTSKERRALYIAKATAQFDTPRIRKEAGEKWDRENIISSKKLQNEKEKTRRRIPSK